MLIRNKNSKICISFNNFIVVFIISNYCFQLNLTLSAKNKKVSPDRQIAEKGAKLY